MPRGETATLGSFSQAKTNQSNLANTQETKALKGSKFFLNYQAFVSHDKNSTEIDTVSNPGDYIEFAENGKAYMYFKGQLDSLDYYFTENGNVSFGDTPFLIKDLANGIYSLSQNEVEANGNYNSVTYMLQKDKDNNLSYSK